jgi:glycosyltransferase involved in cell wall biosynthesis
MRIAFIHPHKAFLPEIDAYTDFFSTHGIKTEVSDPKNYPRIKADVEWHFMGKDSGKARENVIKIHEYTSASVEPLGKWKNIAKRWVNTKPAFRLFLNEYVKNAMGFRDNIPFGFRDMGITDSFLKPAAKGINKEYDFIYTGSVAKEREIEKLIHCFTKNGLSVHSLLILSRDYSELAAKYRQYPNILFRGPVSHDQVKDAILRSRFAINFIPDKEPFNQQASTKFLEYAVLKTPVITTEYDWVKKFQLRNGGVYFYLREDLGNFNWGAVNSVKYSFPDLADYSFETEIRKSGVLAFLSSRFPGLGF